MAALRKRAAVAAEAAPLPADAFSFRPHSELRAEFKFTAADEAKIKKLNDDLMRDTETTPPAVRDEAKESDALTRHTYREAEIGALTQEAYKIIIERRPDSWLSLIETNIRNRGPRVSGLLANQADYTRGYEFDPKYVAREPLSLAEPAGRKSPMRVSLVSDEEATPEDDERRAKKKKSALGTSSSKSLKKRKLRPESGGSSTKKRRRHRAANRISYKNAIWKVFKTVDYGRQEPRPKSLSQQAMQDLDDITHVLCEKLSAQAAQLMRSEKRDTLMAKDFESAMRLLTDCFIKNGLGEHAVKAGAMALVKYKANTQK